MSALDCWIYAKPTEWNALITGTGEDVVPFSYTHNSAVTGYWNTFTGGYEVYNVTGTEAQVQAILDALTDVANAYAWGQGDGFDSLEAWPTDPANILAVMKDHITYNEDGTVATTTPASLTNPNWGHVFFGQSTRIFAGAFSKAFSGAFK